ncbi:DUF5060 domain-containing protein [Brevundimonas denitrificans]|uniref:DUF5060 domain-containing protein n=1 Tax=Brevundimonas denitrificans TaxID=1443434 RepID=UPI00352FBE18
MFTHGGRTIEAPGFYDGEGVWRVRFSPPEEGSWTWTIRSDLADLDGRSGAYARRRRGKAIMGRSPWPTPSTSPMRTARPIVRWAPPATAGLTRARRNGCGRWRPSPLRRSTRSACWSSQTAPFRMNRCSRSRKAGRARRTGISPGSIRPISSGWTSRWPP